MATITMREHKARVAADMARLKAKVARELPVAVRRQLELVLDLKAKKKKKKAKKKA